MKKIIFFLLCSLLISCGINKRDLIGKYSFQGKKMRDSLTINEDTYTHQIYSKSGKLMYKGVSNWHLDNKDRITLFGFYNNEDNLLEDPLLEEDAKEFLMIASFPIYKKGKSIIIEVNSDEGFLYQKLE